MPLTSIDAAPITDASWRTRNIGRLLFVATDRCVREKLRVMHEGGFGTVSDAQLTLFHNLDRSGTRLTVLAARAGLTKQSMIELVDRAEASGYVERRPDPDDKRAKIVLFTPSGLQLLAKLDEAILAADQAFTTVVGADFLDAMKDELGAYVARAPDDGEPDFHPVAAKDDPSWDTRNVGRMLAVTARSFVRNTLSIVHQRGHTDIGEVLLALFRNLDLSGTRLTELALRSHVTKQSMRELVDRAERLGYVERCPDPTDQRAKTIVFTPYGLAALEELGAGIAQAEARFSTLTGPAFFHRLKESLTRFIAYPSDGSATLQTIL